MSSNHSACGGGGGTDIITSSVTPTATSSMTVNDPAPLGTITAITQLTREPENLRDR